MTTPEPVSPAPDTEALRAEIQAILHREGCDDPCPSYCWEDAGPLAKWVAEREAGLRADLDRARAEVERLETLVLEKHELIQGWARYGERVKAERAKYGDMLISALGITGPVGRWFEHLVPAAVQEIERLRAELAGARPIPDDAAAVETVAVRMFRTRMYHVYGDDEMAMRQWNTVLDEEDREEWRTHARALLADLGATPTTGPAPAAADGFLGYEWSAHYVKPGTIDHQEGEPIAAGWWVCGHDSDQSEGPVVQMLVEPTSFASEDQAGHDGPVARRIAELLGEPAAPQDPAEPTAKNQCAYCPSPCEPGYAACEYHVGQISLYGLEGLIAREDTAPPAWTGHDVDVRIDVMGWGTATCRSGCGVIAEGLADVTDPAVDAHRADTLCPSGLVVPLCADCNEQPATDPRLTVNCERVCRECWTEVEANGADDPEED